MQLTLVGLVAFFAALAAFAQPIAAQGGDYGGGDNDQGGGGGGGDGDQGGRRFLLRHLVDEPATANALWTEADENRYYRRNDRRDDRRDYRRYDRRGDRRDYRRGGRYYEADEAADAHGRDNWN